MRVFVSNVDSPVGYSISRIFAQTIVGSRKEEEQPPAGDEEATGDENKSIKAIEEKAKVNYTVIGTLTPPRTDVPITDANGLERPAPPPPSHPGHYFETNDKAKNTARKEAISKFANPGQKPAWVSEIVNVTEDKQALRVALLNSDVIIYDTLSCLEEAAWAIEAKKSEIVLSEAADGFTTPKTFIGVSTIMTWAKTKIESDDPEAFLAEDEYRRRKAHPNFKNHLQVEKDIIKLGKKETLKTYVLAAGLLYHAGDSVFHNYFKSAWLNEPELVCYGDGSNTVPTIHLDDLTNIVLEVAEVLPETRYLLAVDDSKLTLYDILKTISETMGTGVVRKAPKDAAFLDTKLNQSDIDMLQVNLRLDPGHIKEMNIDWKYELGLVENIQTVVQEYRDARGLSSLKIFVHGPPASGKTFFAKKLAEIYELHYLEPEQVMHDVISNLEAKIARNANAEEPDEDLTEAREVLAELKDLAQQNNGVFPDAKIVEYIKEQIKSMPCKNQGYVLDGFPTKLDDAKDIFKSPEDDGQEKGIPTCDQLIIPDCVISLEASDEFIKGRIMKLPESAIANTRNSEEALTKRLEEFRQNNTDENTVLNYFDELEIHPVIISVEGRSTDAIFAAMTKSIGLPHNFGPSPEKIAAQRLIEEEKLAREQEAQEQDRVKREKEEAEKHAKAVEEWKTRVVEVRKQEQEVLEAQSLPLRNYLMKHVMPTVTAGLIELCKVRPEDPIDYLAEYLFKVGLPNKNVYSYTHTK